MGVFSKKITAPAIGSEVKAAAGGSPVGQFYSYSVGYGEEVALSVPTISRARDLIASMIGALSMKHYTLQWTGERYEKIYLPTSLGLTSPTRKSPETFSTQISLATSSFMVERSPRSHAAELMTAGQLLSLGSRPLIFPRLTKPAPNGSASPSQFNSTATHWSRVMSYKFCRPSMASCFKALELSPFQLISINGQTDKQQANKFPVIFSNVAAKQCPEKSFPSSLRHGQHSEKVVTEPLAL